MLAEYKFQCEKKITHDLKKVDLFVCLACQSGRSPYFSSVSFNPSLNNQVGSWLVSQSGNWAASQWGSWSVSHSISYSFWQDQDILAWPLRGELEVGYILTLGVVDGHRGLGVASLLLHNYLSMLSAPPPSRPSSCSGPVAPVKPPVQAVLLHVLTTNTQAIAFYQRRSFVYVTVFIFSPFILWWICLCNVGNTVSRVLVPPLGLNYSFPSHQLSFLSLFFLCTCYPFFPYFFFCFSCPSSLSLSIVLLGIRSFWLSSLLSSIHSLYYYPLCQHIENHVYKLIYTFSLPVFKPLFTMSSAVMLCVLHRLIPPKSAEKPIPCSYTEVEVWLVA